jgi:catechol 2,3-dioxygenase-like lactoylglutathione lyase family enzyme
MPTPDTVPPIEAVVETAVYATDLGAAEVFYATVLGLTVIGREPGRHVFFRVGTAGVLLVFNQETTLKGRVPAARFDRTGPLRPRREARDARRLAAAPDRPWGRPREGVHLARGGRSLYFRDPAGNSVELVTSGLWGTPAGW